MERRQCPAYRATGIAPGHSESEPLLRRAAYIILEGDMYASFSLWCHKTESNRPRSKVQKKKGVKKKTGGFERPTLLWHIPGNAVGG